ncbi:hypothetical protein CK203_047468 [Vitis vinifera]|uniref:Uncharacterized protein n=1 Tax=Vitis vinifera TaxID=29760 RepID=A0A438H6G5_VITVI|nr:hypothetical protein CK203_047468 [Vitis vinifera]
MLKQSTRSSGMDLPSEALKRSKCTQGVMTVLSSCQGCCLDLKNLLSKGAFGAQMVDLGLLQIVQSLKAQAWSDELFIFLAHG